MNHFFEPKTLARQRDNVSVAQALGIKERKGFTLQDNRPQTTLQRKQLQAPADESQLVLQKKANNTGLPDNLKSGVEHLSGISMDDVKVHYNSPQPAQLQAHAYAQGTSIHLAPGQEKHLPHEAWHVVQQKQGRVRSTVQMKGIYINDNRELEKEADVMGAKAVQKKSTAQKQEPFTPKKTGSLQNQSEQVAQRAGIMEYFSGPAIGALVGNYAGTSLGAAGGALAGAIAGAVVGGFTGGITGLITGGVIGAVTGALSGMNARVAAPALAAPLVIPPAHATLAATPDAGRDEEGRCGNFQRARNWQVAHPVQGIIVQRVTRVFNVTRISNGNALAGAVLDAYVTSPNSSVNATETNYWELWEVNAAGAVSDGGDDTFGLCSIIPNGRTIRNTTRGTFTMTGTANFYPTTLAPAAFGFARNAVASAGGLFSTTVNPAGVLPAPSGPTVNYTVNVTWDSSHNGRAYAFNDGYSQVI